MKFGNVVIKKHPNLDLLISNDGWVYIPKQKLKPPKWTKGCVSKSTGYCQLYHNRKCLLVHRLMAETFIRNPNNYEEVDHIDRNRSNNKADNLRWVTKKENSDNSIRVIERENLGVRQCEDKKAYSRERYIAHKEHIRKLQKIYYATHKAHYRMLSQRNRLRKTMEE